MTSWFYLGDRFIQLLRTWLTKPAVRLDELFVSYLLNLTACILAVFVSKLVHLIVLPSSSKPSHAPVDELPPRKPNRRDLRYLCIRESCRKQSSCPSLSHKRIVKRSVQRFVASTGTALPSGEQRWAN